MKIAIYGKLRAGKSVVCNIVSNKLDCEVIEFGSAVQEVVDVLYPEIKGVKNREVLVSVGQHLRKLDKDIWVKVVKQKILNTKNPNILVAGVRQENEYKMLKELGFIFIEVSAKEETRIKRCIEAGDDFNITSLNDATEVVMGEFKADYTINNENDFKDLEIETRNVVAEIISNQLREDFFKEGWREFEKRRVEGNEDY